MMGAYLQSHLDGGVFFGIGIWYAVKNDYVELTGRKLRNLLTCLHPRSTE